MKAVRIHSYGGPQELKIEDLPKPRIKASQVLVQIHDASVNPVDWKIREGAMPNLKTFPFPITMGQDFAGLVFDVGAQVTKFKKGDRVFGFAHGSYAEYAAVAEDKIARIPNSMDFQTAASLPTAGLTALQLLEEAKVREGQLILIHGAGGGVGSFAVQLAKIRGARVAVTASGADYEYLDSLGIEFFIDYKLQRFEEFMTNVDVVIDLVGNDIPIRSLPILRKNGIFVSTVGGISDSLARQYAVNAITFVMSPDSDGLERLAGLYQTHGLRPRLGKVLPLLEARRAQEINQSGLSHGKTVLQVLGG